MLGLNLNFESCLLVVCCAEYVENLNFVPGSTSALYPVFGAAAVSPMNVLQRAATLNNMIISKPFSKRQFQDHSSLLDVSFTQFGKKRQFRYCRGCKKDQPRSRTRQTSSPLFGTSYFRGLVLLSLINSRMKRSTFIVRVHFKRW